MVAINENNYSEDRIRVFQFGYLATCIAGLKTKECDAICRIFMDCDPDMHNKMLMHPAATHIDISCCTAWVMHILHWREAALHLSNFEISKQKFDFSLPRAYVIAFAGIMNDLEEGDEMFNHFTNLIRSAPSDLVIEVLDTPHLLTDEECIDYMNREMTYGDIFQERLLDEKQTLRN